MTTETYASVRAVLDAAEAAGLPLPLINFGWHGVSDDTALTVVHTYPDATWRTAASGSSEWLTARVGGIDLTAYLTTPERRAAHGAALLAKAQGTSTALAQQAGIALATTDSEYADKAVGGGER